MFAFLVKWPVFQLSTLRYHDEMNDLELILPSIDFSLLHSAVNIDNDVVRGQWALSSRHHLGPIDKAATILKKL